MRATRFGFEPEGGRLHVAPETDEIIALSLEGEFDMATSPSIVEQIDDALEHDKHLILDLSQATFIDSSVINVVIQASKAAKLRRRAVVLQLGTAANVERVLELTHIERVVPRTHTRTEAIQAIRELAAAK